MRATLALLGEARAVSHPYVSLERGGNQRGGEQGHGQKERVVAPTGNCRKHVKIS